METVEKNETHTRWRLDKMDKGRGWLTCQQFINEMKSQIPKDRRSYDETSTIWTVTNEDFENIVKPLRKQYLTDENQGSLFDL